MRTLEEVHELVVKQRIVKCHRFYPSGREIWTVVGREGDQLVDDLQQYCSCRHFYYSVMGGKGSTCYHLLGLRLAKHLKAYDEVTFKDVEYASILRAILKGL